MFSTVFAVIGCDNKPRRKKKMISGFLLVAGVVCSANLII